MAKLPGEILECLTHVLRRQLRVEDVAVLRCPRDHTEQVEGGSADHDRFETEPTRSEVGIECQ